MKKPEQIISNYGIIASISWNSNEWADHPTEEDLKKSNYEYVKDNVRMHESLNFGHDKFPVEEEGFYIGYTPMFNRPPSFENAKDVHIVFFISTDYHNNNQRSIVGFYGEPAFGDFIDRRATHEMYKEYDSGNIFARPENIVNFKNPVVLNNEKAHHNNLLPEGKKISQQGFNYLNSDNVFNILSEALSLNANNQKLEAFLKTFPLKIELTKEKIEVSDFLNAVDNIDADSLKSLQKLEKKMKKAIPEVKQRISAYIERGAIAQKIKGLNEYKCQVCEVQGNSPYSFKKPDGTFYIEAHHVEPVSSKKEGVLSIANIITVCPNHHRQLHFGNAYLKSADDNSFDFIIEKQDVKIKKIQLGKTKVNN